MAEYVVKFTVDGKMTVQNVNANSSIDARKIIEAQYRGAKITFYTVTKR